MSHIHILRAREQTFRYIMKRSVIGEKRLGNTFKPQRIYLIVRLIASRSACTHNGLQLIYRSINLYTSKDWWNERRRRLTFDGRHLSTSRVWRKRACFTTIRGCRYLTLIKNCEYIKYKKEKKELTYDECNVLSERLTRKSSQRMHVEQRISPFFTLLSLKPQKWKTRNHAHAGI